MQYDLLLKRPKLTIILFTIVTAIISINAINVQITSDIEVYMPKNEPSVIILNEIRQQWPIDSLMIYLKGDNLTTISSLKEINAMEDALNPLPNLDDGVAYTASIASLVRETNANMPWGEDKIPDSPLYVNFLLSFIPDEIKSNFISRDGKNAVIIVTTNKSANAQTLLDEKVYPISESAKNFKAVPTGMITMYAETVKWIMSRIYGITLLSLLLIVLILFAFHKDAKVVFIVIMPVLYAIGLTFGTMGLMKTKFPPTVISVLPLLASLGVAYSLHMVNYFMERKERPIDAIKRMINTTGKAVFLSALTTIVGFASLLSSNMPPISSMGLAFLIGVLYSFITTMILVPTMLLVMKIGRKKSIEWRRLANLTKYRKQIVMVLIILSLISIASIPKVSTRSSVWEMMPMKMESNVLMHEYSKKFHAGNSGVILVDSGKKEGIFEPFLLKKLDEMEKLINVGVENVSVYSVVDVIKKMNFGKIPETKEDVKAIVEKMPDKYKTMLLDRENYRKTLMYVDMPIMSVKDTQRAVYSVDEIISHYNSQIKGYGEIKQLTGLAAITAELNAMLMSQQFRFTFISLLLVYLSLLIVFRSFRFASLTMLPIVLLLLWEPSLLVLLNIPLNVATITVSSIAIGVGIDFSVHITERVMEEIKEKSGLASIKTALTRKSLPLVEATLSLVGGGIPIFLMEYEMITQFIVLVLFMLLFACIGSILTLASIYSAKNGKIVEGWK